MVISGFEKRFRIYHLRFPNEEVKYGFLNNLAPAILGYRDADRPLSLYRLVTDLEKGNVESFMRRLISSSDFSLPETPGFMESAVLVCAKLVSHPPYSFN